MEYIWLLVHRFTNRYASQLTFQRYKYRCVNFSGISYQTHPQADLTSVATFKDIIKIVTLAIPRDNVNNQSKKSFANTAAADDKYNPCKCWEVKTQLRITTRSNDEDLVITCDGINVSCIL